MVNPKVIAVEVEAMKVFAAKNAIGTGCLDIHEDATWRYHDSNVDKQGVGLMQLMQTYEMLKRIRKGGMKSRLAYRNPYMDMVERAEGRSRVDRPAVDRAVVAGPEEPKWPAMVQKIVEQGGGIWKGLQELGDDRYAAMFNSPSSHSTLMLPIEGLTPEKVQEHIQKDTAKFGSWEHPEEAGSVEDRIADQMEKRSFSEEEVGDDWLEFSHNTDYEGDGTWIRVHYKDGEVTKVECWSGDRSGSPTTREGWDGLVSFTNTYGD